MKNLTLPDTMHELLAVAITDAKAISRRVYKPHFGYWHCPIDNGKCLVCLAGSIIARSLNSPAKANIRPSFLSTDVQRKMDALNAMRHGNWLHAYDLIYNSAPDRSTLDALLSLPAPAQCDFIGWRQFNAHLKSLQRILPKLRAVENNFPAQGAAS